MFARLARMAAVLFRGVPEDESRRCMYVDCGVIVQPYRGYRRGGMVFCGDDHARRDQDEALI